MALPREAEVISALAVSPGRAASAPGGSRIPQGGVVRGAQDLDESVFLGADAVDGGVDLARQEVGQGQHQGLDHGQEVAANLASKLLH